jgi:subtilase family serine protease
VFSFSSSARALAARAGAVAVALPIFIGGPVAGAAHAMVPAVDSSAQYESMGSMPDVGTTPFPCQKTTPATCFGPAQIRAAYDVQSLLDSGVTGTGRTIVIVDAFQSPTIQKDLAAFDALWSIPAPPAFNILAPDGLTPFNAADGNQLNWSLEISIDVEWAHAIAPGARIELVLAKNSDDTEMLKVTKYAIDHNLGDVISQSFGEAEMCASAGLLRNQHRVFSAAGERGITLFASSGDQGAARPTCDGTSLVMSASTPASDPNVTGVGGTHLVADGTTGTYQSEAAWVRSGGGFSTIYRRPGYQAGVQTNPHRGVPDVAFDADSSTGLIVAWSALVPPTKVGLGKVGGTSIGSAAWSGLVALADQSGHERLGQINASLYGAAKSKTHGGFHDVITGNNSFMGITGFSAAPGWDATTGLGSPQAKKLLSRLSGRDGEGGHGDGEGG